MKRFGIVAFVLVGFIGGIAFVYSCGGGGSGGSTANAQPPDPSNIQSLYTSQSLAVANSYDWLTLGSTENFILTDIVSNYSFCLRVKDGEYRFCTTSAVGNINYSLSSGIRFHPGETIRAVFEGTSGWVLVSLSGYTF